MAAVRNHFVAAVEDNLTAQNRDTVAAFVNVASLLLLNIPRFALIIFRVLFLLIPVLPSVFLKPELLVVCGLYVLQYERSTKIKTEADIPKQAVN